MEKCNKLFAFLSNLGLEPNMDTFRERKRIQKLIYIAQEFNIDLGFNFTWYLHGPYSPDLTKSIFDVIERNFQVEKINLSPEEIEKLSHIKYFLKGVQSTEILELIGSLIYLRKVGEKYHSSKHDIVSVLKEKKPHFSDDEINACWKKIESANAYLKN